MKENKTLQDKFTADIHMLPTFAGGRQAPYDSGRTVPLNIIIGPNARIQKTFFAEGEFEPGRSYMDVLLNPAVQDPTTTYIGEPKLIEGEQFLIAEGLRVVGVGCVKST